MAVSGAMTRGSHASGYLQFHRPGYADIRLDLSESRSDAISVSLVPEKDKVFNLLSVPENLLAVRHTGPQADIAIDDISEDRKRVVTGRSVEVRVVLGGRGTIKEQTKTTSTILSYI